MLTNMRDVFLEDPLLPSFSRIERKFFRPWASVRGKEVQRRKHRFCFSTRCFREVGTSVGIRKSAPRRGGLSYAHSRARWSFQSSFPVAAPSWMTDGIQDFLRPSPPPPWRRRL